MGGSRPSGPQGQMGGACFPATPGTLGVNDAASPDNGLAARGAPGPEGIYDPVNGVCRMTSPPKDPGRVATYPLDPGRSTSKDDEELFVLSEDLFWLLVNKGASNSGSLSDIPTALRALRDFGIGGGNYYVKHVPKTGKSYVILKGYAGLRKYITGTRYLADHAKMIALGIGKGAAQGARMSGVLTIVLVGAANVVQYILDDEALLTDLGVALFVDFSKAAMSTVAGAAAGALTAIAVTGGIAAPIVAGIVVGIVVSEALDAIDEKYEVKKTLQKWVRSEVDEVTREANRWWSFLNTPEGINWLQNGLLYGQ